MKEMKYNGEYLRVSANINLDAIRENMKATRRIIGTDTKLMAVVKADAYGHGAVKVAQAIDSIVDAYAVAIVEEGIELREAGITKPILILGYTAKDLYPDVIKYDLTQTIFQSEMAEYLNEEAIRQNKTAVVHIKLDTGMGRIGYQPSDDSIADIKKIQSFPHIKMEGIFSHFACADCKDKTSAYHQYQCFLSFVKKLEDAGISIPVKHISNSASIMDMQDTSLSMVRSGINTYGLYPSQEVDKAHLSLYPAMELKTHISFVKELGPGHGIGYGSTFVTKHPMKIATVPVGYGDGFPRALSNKGRVLVHGKYAPIIGRVCMDQFMIDVTDIPMVKQDDVVTLVGKDGEHSISVEEQADLAGSFNYEFICNVGKRIPRVYYENGIPVSLVRM